MLKVWKIIRNCIGCIIMLSGVLLVFTSEMPFFSFVSFFLLGMAISTLYQDKISGKKRFFIGFIFFLMFGIFTPSTQENTNAVTDKVVLETEKEKPLYDTNVIYTLSTEKGNGDDSIDKYGVEGVKKINELMLKAAELMSKNTQCDKLNIVTLSAKSSPENIVIYGHCINGARFNITEQDINDNNPVKTDKEKMHAAVPYLMLNCEKTIKAHLNFPSTYESSIWDSGERVFDDRAVIETVFTAKNAYNLKLKYRAKCYYNDKHELTGFEMDEYR